VVYLDPERIVTPAAGRARELITAHLPAAGRCYSWADLLPPLVTTVLDRAIAQAELSCADLRWLQEAARHAARDWVPLRECERACEIVVGCVCKALWEDAEPGHCEAMLGLSRWVAEKLPAALAVLRAAYVDEIRRLGGRQREDDIVIATLLEGDDATATAGALGRPLPEPCAVLALTGRDAPAEPVLAAVADLGEVLYAAVWERSYLVALCPVPETAVGAAVRSVRALAGRAVAACGSDFVCGISISNTAGGVGQAAREAVDVAQILARSDPPRRVGLAEEVTLEVLLGSRPGLRRRLLQRVADVASRPELWETLTEFYAADLERGRTARRLGIHRSTLDYRLNRVEELTDASPTSVAGILLFAAARAALAAAEVSPAEQRDGAARLRRSLEEVLPGSAYSSPQDVSAQIARSLGSVRMTTLGGNLTAALAISGGTPVRTRPWPTYDKGDVFICEEDEAAATAAIRARRYFRYDDRHIEQTRTRMLERRLCEMFGSRHALACASGTTAIALALLALDLPPGSPVACPAFTFPATPSAILLAGHQPVLVECDENLHPDLEHLARVLEDGARAAVIVHMRGYASDMPAIMDLARSAGVPVVEDAVPALGAQLNGQYLGTFGTFGAFSTQSDKSLNTGEGGFLLTDDDAAYARAVVYSGAYEGRMQRHFPESEPGVDDLAYPIFGFRMDEIRAALACSLLEHLPGRLEAHRRNHDHVVRALAGEPRIALRRPVAEGAYLGEALLFRLPGATVKDCAWFAEALAAEGIEARALGDPLRVNVRSFWHWRFLLGPDPDKSRALLPRAARYVGESIDIPLSANLTISDCDDLIAAVMKVAAAFRA
jgi:dTDP-4-amino-4,6-dideoxygalactose transaminase